MLEAGVGFGVLNSFQFRAPQHSWESLLDKKGHDARSHIRRARTEFAPVCSPSGRHECLPDVGDTDRDGNLACSEPCGRIFCVIWEVSKNKGYLTWGCLQ